MGAITKFGILPMMFVVDLFSLIRDTGQQIDWDLLGNKYRRGAFPVRVTTAVVIGDTVVAVAALPKPVRRGQTLTFGGGDTLTLAADYDAGVTSITTEPAPSAIADETTGFGIESGYGDSGHAISAGTVMSRVAASRKLVPRSDRPGAEPAECVLLTDAKTDSKTDSLTGYGVTYAGVLYENFMPDADPATGLLPNAYKTELTSRFVWKRATDSRGA